LLIGGSKIQKQVFLGHHIIDLAAVVAGFGNATLVKKVMWRSPFHMMYLLL
jgi:hypothetical protein